MKSLKFFTRLLITGAFMTALWGCSSGNSDAPTILNGKHPANWYVDHRAAYLQRAEQCYECHGRDLKGGLSKVSCFSASINGQSCHAGGPPAGHPVGWGVPTVHGPHAKALVSGVNGFSYCQNCHGTLFDGGTANKACSSCHGVNAPHSPKPWRGGTYTHTTTDTSNAPICALCHTAGKNLTPALQQGVYATGAPGCFNNTLCHGQVGHPANWKEPVNHGASAKAKPSATQGLASCKNCHADDFSGGLSNQSCFTCHGVNAPHAPKPWRGGPYTHTTTDTGNAAVCAQCHTAGNNLTPGLKQANYVAGTPGCFNSTLCHGAAGHPVGWANSDQHGGTAKALPGTTSGFDYCRNCHGVAFAGGAGQTCLGSCHGSGVMAPHSPKPWAGTAHTHTTTDPGNASICNLCHNNGTNSTLKPSTPATAGTAPGCFNSTLCHGAMSHPAGWNDPTVHGVHAKAAVSTTDGFSRCQECHGTKFDGGIVNKTCYSCHGVSAPHAPKPWRGGTYTHTTTDQSNVATCALCHTAGANLTAALKLPSYASGAPGCFNSTLCHGAVGHPAGWSAATQHGSAAIAVPSITTGLSYCITCHTDYRTGSGTSCFQCHTTAPHPATPWRGTTASGTTHTRADLGNAAQCARCHLNNARLTAPITVPAGTTPGCFNNTLCHGVIAHPAGWAAANQHGATAKAAPSGTAGFAYCTTCHVDYRNGTGSSCFQCHTTAPHPATPWRGTTASGTTHTTTDQGDAAQCGRCHLNNARLSTPITVPPGTTPGCFNNTLCHGSITGHAFPYPGATHMGSAGVSPFTGCTGCHAVGTATSPYPVAVGVKPDCMACHTKAAPVGCYSCHGTNNTGLPVGSTFPDRAGRHSAHSGYVCSTCHSGGGTGAATHGNSNRVKKNPTNVMVTLPSGITFKSNGSTTTGGGTCTGTCHGETHSGRSW